MMTNDKNQKLYEGKDSALPITPKMKIDARMALFQEKRVKKTRTLFFKKARMCKMQPQGLFDGTGVALHDSAVSVVSQAIGPMIDKMEREIVEPTRIRFDEIVERAESTFKDALKDLDMNLGLRVGQMILGVAACVAVYYALKYALPHLIKAVKLTLWATYQGASTFVNGLLSSVELEPQSGFDEKAAGLLATVIGLCSVEKFNTRAFFKSVLDHRQRDNLAKVITSLPELLNWCYTQVKAWLSGCPAMYFASTGDKRVDLWIDSVKEFVIRMEKGDVDFCKSNLDYLRALFVSGKTLQYSFIENTRTLDPVRAVIRMGLKDLDEVFEKFNKSSFNKTSLRIKPLTILLKGKSGVGKSSMTVPLLDKILMRSFSNHKEKKMFLENNMDFIYSRNAETEYWDGYYGQKAIVFDDFMQVNDAKATGAITNEPFDLIRASNIYPMLLHKAHLEDKGNSYLSSRIILCSTNNHSLQNDTLREQEALLRRFDISGTVVPKREFCTDETRDKVQGDRRLKKMDGFNPDVYEIYVNNEILSFSEFVDRCVEKYFEIERSGSKFLEDVHSLREEEFHDAPLAPQSAFDYDTLEQEFKAEMDALEPPSAIQAIKKRYDYFKQKVASCFEACRALIKEALDKHPYLTWLGMIIAGTTAAFGVSWLWGKKNFTPQSYSNQKYLTKTDPKNYRMLIKNLKHQSGFSNDHVDKKYRSVVSRNYYVLTNNTTTIGGFLLFTHDKSAIMNDHVYDELCQMDKFMMLNWGSLWSDKPDKYGRAISGRELQRCKVTRSNVDLVSVDFTNLSTPIRSHKDIRDHIVTDCDESDFGENPPMRIYLFSAGDGSVKSTDLRAHKEFASYLSFKRMPVYAYPIFTQKGHCGCLAFSTDPCNHFGKVLFMHCAGDGNKGVGVGIPKDLLAGPTLEPQSRLSSLFDEDDESNFELCGLPVLGRVDDPPHICRKTKLAPSLLTGWCRPPLRAPAVLNSRDGEDPFYLSLARYATKDTQVDTGMVQIAAMSYGSELNKLPFVSKDILTFEQAVQGIDSRKYINGIPRKTSAGYPYCNQYGNGKKQIFGFDGDYTFDNPQAIQVRKNVEEKEALLKNGERPAFLYLDAMKDELRSKKKIASMQTRMISCCPLDLTILTRMYFGNFTSFMMENKIENGCAVGINPMSRDWSKLADLVSGEDSQCIAGDFTGFDSSQCSAITYEILDIINRWYDDEHTEVRRLLWYEVTNSLHIHGEFVVAFDHCLPSGHPMTSIINSMFVNIAFRYCWMRQVDSMCSIDSFKELVKLVAYGDDNIVGVRPVAQTYGFNFNAIQYWMRELGLTYTPENKEDSGYDYKELTECTFLKRGFRLENGKWFAPLDIDVILEMPMWYRKGPDVFQRQVDNIDNSLRELSLHDEETFVKFGSALLIAAHEHKDKLPMSFILFPRDYYIEKCFSSWAEEESLGSANAVNSGFSIVPFPDESSDCDSVAEVSGFEPQSNIGPAANKINERQVNTSSVGHTTNDPVTNSVDSSETQPRQVNQTTGFLQDAEEREFQPFPIERLDVSHMVPSNVNIDRSDIIKLLGTPVKIRHGVYLLNDLPNKTLDTVVLPFDSNNIGHGTDAGQGLWLQRLNAFQGFRGTAVVTLMVNANRFCQGRLLMTFQPGQNIPEQTYIHNQNLITRSQMPNVQLNVNRDTSVVLRTPFVSSWPAYDLTRNMGAATLETANGIMGILNLVVYSELKGVGMTYSIWLHFEDVELINPTYAPQSLFFDGVEEESNQVFEDLQPQANIIDSEIKDGIASGPLRRFSEAAGVIARIPALSSYAGTASWFLNGLANAASAFGFSKPSVETKMTRVINQGNPYWLNGDGESADYKVALSAQNKVDVIPGWAGNDLDEMSIEYMCNRPTYLTRFSWDTTDLVGSVVFDYTLRPVEWAFETTYNTTVGLSMPPIALFSRLFANWRADLVFTFKFVKTEFHTGRLSVSFRPGFNETGSEPQDVFLPREILDIKESDTFIVTVPYCALTPYLSSGQGFGQLNLRVVNPLNSANVSPSVDVIVEVAAKNVQFSGLSNTVFAPMYGDASNWQPQSNFEAPREKSITLPGLASQNEREIHSARIVCGEEVKSIKTILNRMCAGRHVNSTTGIKTTSIAPFIMTGVYQNGTALRSHNLCYDYLSLFSSMFTLSRGSIRIGVSTRAHNDYSLSSVTFPYGTGLRPLAATTAINRYPNGDIPYKLSVQGSPQIVNFPHYGISHARDNEIKFSNDVTTAFGVPSTVLAVNCISAYNVSELTFYRGAGDDFQLGYFIGVPVLHEVIASSSDM